MNVWVCCQLTGSQSDKWTTSMFPQIVFETNVFVKCFFIYLLFFTICEMDEINLAT